MTQTPISPDLVQQVITFHGHSCPGLAFGIRVAELVMARFNRASDEEIVALVETDMCAIDAIQFMTGCTFGKGNLIHLDYGKNAFTFYSRSDGKGIRIIARPHIFPGPDDELIALQRKKVEEGLNAEEQKKLSEIMAVRTKRIMEAELDDLFEVKSAQSLVPRKARILEGVTCQECGEVTMESRTRRFLGQTLCIPCFEANEKRY